VDLFIEQFAPNLLTVLTGENSPPLPQNFVRTLYLGQFLTGEVIDLPSPGRAVLQFEGQKLIVEPRYPVALGQILTARVEQLSPIPTLKLISPDSPGSPERTVSLPATAAKDVAIETPVTDVVRSSLIPSQRPQVRTLSAALMDTLKLVPGQEFSAKVIGTSSDGNVRVLYQGFDVSVSVPESVGDATQLRAGSQVFLRAEPQAPGAFALVLSRQDTASPKVNADWVKPYLASRQSLGEMLSHLERVLSKANGIKGTSVLDGAVLDRLKWTLELLSAQKGKAPDAPTLQKQVDYSGSGYESKVRDFLFSGKEGSQTSLPREISFDLKGLLLKLGEDIQKHLKLEAPQASSSHPVRDLLAGLQKAVDNIELNQLTHALARNENAPLVVQIPNPFAGTEKSVKLLVRPMEDEDGTNSPRDRKNFNLVFLLNLSILGNVRVDAQVKGQTASVRFTVENNAIARFIDSQAGFLQDRLRGLNYNVQMTSSVSEEVRMDEDELGLLLVEAESRLVDLRT